MSKYGRRMTSSQKEKCIDMYLNGSLLIDIREEVGFAIPSIRRHLKKEGIVLNGVNPRKNYNFEKFNREDVDFWYFLGIFASDGSIQNNGSQLNISSKDLEFLQKIQEIFCKRGSIRISNVVKGKKYYSLSIYSTQIINIVKDELNFSEKTYDIEFPNPPNEDSFFAFMRGVFDGDGCIYKNKSVQFCSASDIFIEGVRKAISDYNFKLGVYNVGVKGGKAKQVHILGGREKRAKFLRRMYKNSEHLRLDRKFKTFIKEY